MSRFPVLLKILPDALSNVCKCATRLERQTYECSGAWHNVVHLGQIPISAGPMRAIVLWKAVIHYSWTQEMNRNKHRSPDLLLLLFLLPLHIAARLPIVLSI